MQKSLTPCGKLNRQAATPYCTAFVLHRVASIIHADVNKKLNREIPFRVEGKKHPSYKRFPDCCAPPSSPKFNVGARKGDTCGREKNTRSCGGDRRIGLNIEFGGEGEGQGQTIPFGGTGVFSLAPDRPNIQQTAATERKGQQNCWCFLPRATHDTNHYTPTFFYMY